MGLFDNIKEYLTLKKQTESLKNEIQAKQKELQEKEHSFRQILDRTSSAQLASEASIKKRDELIALENEAQLKLNDVTKKIENQSKRLKSGSVFIKSVKYAVEEFSTSGEDRSKQLLSELELLEPTFEVKPHAMGLRDLRKQYKENSKLIDSLLETYKARYTTKANASIYSLLVIALKSELQNCINSMKYNKLDKSISGIKQMTQKYLQIVAEGNQSIAPTITRFIGQIEMLFIEAVKIEYEYYVLQEKIKEEQRAIREQMRQEAEERKILEQQKKQLEAEEKKYQVEMDRIKEMIAAEADESKKMVLEARLSEVSELIDGLEGKKEEILKLQNGQAGYVYIISNLGSFGENMFKIGMTRRMQPIDRINELGDASVPFSFDIHAMIWSDDAVNLENTLHRKFDSNRVNKINRRKEFFKVSVDDLMVYVNDVDPTAEFETTMLAEQYRQTLAIEQGIIDLDSLDSSDLSQDDSSDSEENDEDES